MGLQHFLFYTAVLAPVLLMLVAAIGPQMTQIKLTALWRGFIGLSVVSLSASAVLMVGAHVQMEVQPWLRPTTVGLALAVLVQLLGTVIGLFSSRYLEGESGQRGYIAKLASVLSAVQLLLLADHWLVLIGAWSLVGIFLQQLLCFYPDRPFAVLAAHKKRLADLLADGLLIIAAVLAWHEVGSGSLSVLWRYLAHSGCTLALEASAVCLVLAVILRTALLPFHGWLIQVMEAPTPVSALLHAGVVNLGGFILIRFSLLLEHAMAARWILVAFGLTTALLAGMVMLTRISIKVRLAWSTVAQMGFMVLECGLGLYSLAFLHLIGHSLYKAHAFLSASSVVGETRIRMMWGPILVRPISLWLAPIVTTVGVLGMQQLVHGPTWPWWWSVILGFAWAPLLWVPFSPLQKSPSFGRGSMVGVIAVAGLTGIMMGMDTVSLGIKNTPETRLGLISMAGMALLYLFQIGVQIQPSILDWWRRWSYSGFYIDEFYTRLSLWVWPTSWSTRSQLVHCSVLEDPAGGLNSNPQSGDVNVQQRSL